MAGKKRSDRKADDRRPVVTDDFIYNEPDSPAVGAENEPLSDTPEEAIRKLRRRKSENTGSDTVPAGSSPSEGTEEDTPRASSRLDSPEHGGPEGGSQDY